jgi:hypothetical protein
VTDKPPPKGALIALEPANPLTGEQHVARVHPDGSVTPGIVRPLGSPDRRPGATVITLEQDPDVRGRALIADEQPLAAGNGPAQVASDAYRAGWAAIFGHRPPMGKA